LEVDPVKEAYAAELVTENEEILKKIFKHYGASIKVHVPCRADPEYPT